MIIFGSLLELLFLIGVVRFVLSFNHYLSMLLSLEFIILSLFLFICFFIGINLIRRDLIFLFLAIIIIEGVFGLCLLVLLSRYGGNEIRILLN